MMSTDLSDHIPLLDDLIDTESTQKQDQTINFEAKINSILQRHTAEAVTEILAIMEKNKINND